MLNPDAFYNDWYGWITNQSGHFLLGIVLFALVCLLARRPIAALTVAIGFAAWEAWQLLIVFDLSDALSDWSFVTLGTLFAWAAWLGLRRAVVAVLVVVAVLLALGVYRRTKR